MSLHRRVVWSEGLLLTPQHFQVQDHYHEEFAAELLRGSRSYTYGLSYLRLNQESIRNGQVRVEEARGILRSGVPFSVGPEGLPDPRDVGSHFPVQHDRALVYIGVRTWRAGEPQFATEAGGESGVYRYRLEEPEFADEATGREKRKLHVARPVLRLLFPDDDLDAYDHIPVAEVERRDGKYAYRADYIPPCLGIGASPAINRLLTSTYEALVTKSRWLRERRGAEVNRFALDDPVLFWLLAVVSGAIPQVVHLLHNPMAHPEAVYLTLARLAGELSAMGTETAAPAYEHEAPEPALATLAKQIIHALQPRAPEGQHFFVPLDRPKDRHYYVGRFEDDRELDPNHALLLGITSAASPEELVKRIKVSSPDHVEDVVVFQLDGVAKTHTPHMPPVYRGKPGYVYFALQKNGEDWRRIASSRAISLYVPHEYIDASLELVSLRGGA